MFKKIVISVTVICTVFSLGCKDKPTDPKPTAKESGFSAPEEFIENPSVKRALDQADLDTYLGSNPPPLAGTYLVNGSILDASSEMSQVIGQKIASEFQLYNQTNSGKISFKEKIQGYQVWGSGGYVTGDNGYFSIWQESRQTGDEAGLPNDITIWLSLIMSGIKYSDGNLKANGLSVVTRAESSNKDYDLDKIKRIWWLWQADFKLQPGLLKELPKAAKIPDNIIRPYLK